VKERLRSDRGGAAEPGHTEAALIDQFAVFNHADSETRQALLIDLSGNLRLKFCFQTTRGVNTGWLSIRRSREDEDKDRGDCARAGFVHNDLTRRRWVSPHVH